MRHAPFAIGPVERDVWLVRMHEAITWSDPPAGVAERLQRYFDMAAEAMRNRD
jgi:hemoglobin